MFETRKFARVTAAAVLCLALTVPAWGTLQAGDCDARAGARLDTKEPTGSTIHLQFVVEVTTNEPCAHIHYDLILEIRMSNGQVRKVRKPREVKLNDGSLEEYVRHTIEAGADVTSYEAVIVSCDSCSM